VLCKTCKAAKGIYIKMVLLTFCMLLGCCKSSWFSFGGDGSSFAEEWSRGVVNGSLARRVVLEGVPLAVHALK
jgi:hypothetical protein